MGTLCFDVDECEEVDACGKHMDCDDTEGNYTCSCSHGYENRNGECIDIDECLRWGVTSLTHGDSRYSLFREINQQLITAVRS